MSAWHAWMFYPQHKAMLCQHDFVLFDNTPCYLGSNPETREHCHKKPRKQVLRLRVLVLALMQLIKWVLVHGCLACRCTHAD